MIIVNSHTDCCTADCGFNVLSKKNFDSVTGRIPKALSRDLSYMVQYYFTRINHSKKNVSYTSNRYVIIHI